MNGPAHSNRLTILDGLAVSGSSVYGVAFDVPFDTPVRRFPMATLLSFVRFIHLFV